MASADFYGRRESRWPVEMVARFRAELTTVTIILKDLTPAGARVECVGPLGVDDAVMVAMPGLAPKLAFVAWSNGHSAGLEFADPLPQQVFMNLIAAFGRGRLPAVRGPGQLAESAWGTISPDGDIRACA